MIMLLNTLPKNIQIPTHKELFIYDLSGVKVLVLSTTLGHRYLKIPTFATLSKNDFEFKLSFHKSVDLNVQVNFVSKLKVWLQSIGKVCRNKLLFKGLGYKATLSDSRSKLNLKLGYSHPLALTIPTDRIGVKIVKNTITVKGHDLTEIGNFARKIRRLRAPDAYKGKGVWYKNEHRSLKELRKK